MVATCCSEFRANRLIPICRSVAVYLLSCACTFSVLTALPPLYDSEPGVHKGVHLCQRRRPLLNHLENLHVGKPADRFWSCLFGTASLPAQQNKLPTFPSLACQYPALCFLYSCLYPVHFHIFSSVHLALALQQHFHWRPGFGHTIPSVGFCLYLSVSTTKLVVVSMGNARYQNAPGYLSSYGRYIVHSYSVFILVVPAVIV